MDDDKENDCSSSNDVVVEAADSLHLEKLKGTCYSNLATLCVL